MWARRLPSRMVVSTTKGDKDGMRFLNFSKAKTTGFVASIVPAVYPKLQPLESYPAS